ncbi:hypothetical protein FXO38_03523 [Capsicum annuum]|nr:hypothetical protein FXO38_03523 [Capsicum annuum]KAF3680171.1 hypothetical protein FXO37_03461 [Capsicum annuum]
MILLKDLKDKSILNKYKEKLFLVWFTHYIILVRDANKVIEDGFLELIEDLKKFNSYPWGYDNYKLTIKYLLTKLTPNMITLYFFSWAFMDLVFKAIPPLQTQVKDYPDEVSHPKILRWLTSKSNTRIKEVVHPWLVPTEKKLGMTSFITLDLGAIFGGVTGGVDDVGGSHDDAYTVPSHDDDHVDSQERIKMFEFTLYTTLTLVPLTLTLVPLTPLHPHILIANARSAWTNRINSLKKKSLTKAVEELTSKKVSKPYIPTVKVRKKKIAIRHILSIMKQKRIATLPSPKVYEVQGLLEKVDIYAKLDHKKKVVLRKTINSKQRPKTYTMNTFPPKTSRR